MMNFFSYFNSPIGQFLLMAIIWTLISIISIILKTKEKFGLTIYPLVLVYESKKFNRFIESAAKRNPVFWRRYSKVSGPLSLILIFIALGYFVLNFILLLNNTLIVTESGLGAGAPLVPIIPFITVPTNLFIALMIGSALAILPHEFAHGIVAAREGLPVKSSGIYVIGGVILGGFVRLDDEVEKNLEKILSNEGIKEDTGTNLNLDMTLFSKKVYRVAAAGLLINLLLFGVIIGLTSLTFKQDGVLIVDVLDNTPASKGGLMPNDVIKRIGDYTIRNIEDLHNALSKLRPNETVMVYTDRGVFEVTLGINPDDPSRAYLGVHLWNFYNFTLLRLDKQLSNNLYITLIIAYVLQLTVVLLNALPLYVTDGSKVLLFYMLSRRFKLDSAMKIFNTANFVGLGVLAANLWISLVGFI